MARFVSPPPQNSALQRHLPTSYHFELLDATADPLENGGLSDPFG